MKRARVPNRHENYIQSVACLKRRKLENIDHGKLKPVCDTELDSLKNLSHINQLPDSLLLEIFSFLDFNGICICLQVCMKWKRIAKDDSLKKVVTWMSCQGNIPRSLKNRFSCFTRAFKLQRKESFYPKYILLDKKFVLEMSKRSNNLKKLSLCCCKLPEISIQDLPASLKHLSVRKSPLFIKTLFKSGSFEYVPQLSSLKLKGSIIDGSYLDGDATLFELCIFKSLKVLNLSFNSGIGDESIKSLMEILPQLEVLNLESTNITNNGVHLILTNCANIQALLIGNNQHIGDIALNIPLRGKLSYLCVRNTYITLHQLHVFLSSCPEKSPVKVEFFKKCIDCRVDLFVSEFGSKLCQYHYSFKHKFPHTCS